ncbi:MaoC/PaaZ C-terminal domain-containing protein [Paraglaciecola marina]|uniref:MaoC/PaaZ C-terminal domain-containing protein n=1 Tax=Paraglaciecola marina TaxID=2500157 RepID=UPI00105D5728|nr:MaoC/PaaZ C-terminal domain-containing protein [Paraglaciecola marina]
MLQIQSTVELSSFPSLKFLLARLPFSFFKKGKKIEITNSLPRLEYVIDGIRVNTDKCYAFHQVTKWHSKTALIHPCFIHTIAFPLHLTLLLLPNFPFPLFGLIHIGNKITQYRPITINESLQFRCNFADLKPHPKGWEFSIEVRVYSSNELVWESLSTNLYTNTKAIDTPNNKKNKNYTPSSSGGSNYGAFQLESNIGRQFARCSGDYNPIHLNKWLAKLFGLKVQIAHGMWSKSWCISTLQLRHPSLFEKSFSVEVSFKRPLYLPNNINLFVKKSDAQLDSKLQFSIESQNLNCHLFGVLKVL